MTERTEFLLKVLFIGIGATVVMDLWLYSLRQLGVSTLNMAFLGRWIGHLPKGQFFHENISKSSAIHGELFIGWIAHYSIGIGFAALLIGVYGLSWTQSPSLIPALIVGLLTLIAPLFILQPALGAGIASSNTPTPLMNSIKSLMTHTVYGVGLYLAAWLAKLTVFKT